MSFRAVLSAVLTGAGCLVHPRQDVAGPDVLAVAGPFPSEELVVHEDAWGIPHVQAASPEDAAWALGMLHAEERLFQMDLHRRIGHGRLSELLGKRTIDADRYLRTRGFSRSAAQALQRLPSFERELLDAYARGVNDAIARLDRLPPEYRLLRARPEPWTPLDSMVWIKVMAYNLSGDAASELLRARVIEKVGVERAEWFLPEYPADGVRISSIGAADPGVAPLLEPERAPATAAPPIHAGRWAEGRALARALVATTGELASNSLVLAGTRTASGAPILGNDPHLGTSMPSVWYLCELEAPGYHVVGASFPGIPGVAIGHNERVAWGLTTGGLDPQDLYFEELRGDEIRDGEGWTKLRWVDETIQVRGARDVPLRVAIGPRGPIVTDFLPPSGRQLSLRWIGDDPDDTTLQAFVALTRASNADEVVGAVDLFTSPAHNFVFADRDGHIGWKVGGKVPRRGGRDGRVPGNGADPAHAWQGYVPASELPSLRDPAAGAIVTANNHPVPDDWPTALGFVGDDPYRAQRIVELLGDEGGWTVEAVQRIQMDVTSAQALELLGFLRGLKSKDPRVAPLLELLRAWDGELRVDSAAAAIYEVWMIELLDVIARHHLGDELFSDWRALRGEFFRRVLLGDAADLCRQPGVRDCTHAAEIALGRARIALERRASGDPASWQWGELHRLELHHPLAFTRGLARRLDVREPSPGDRFTVNVGGYRLADFTQVWHASYRQVIDLADWDRARWILPSGQSGVPARAHYRDLVAPYLRGEGLPLWFGEAGRAAAVRVRRFVRAPRPA